MEGFGLCRPGSTTEGFRNFISQRASSRDLSGGLHRRELRTGATYSISRDDCEDRDPFSAWKSCEEAQDDFMLDDPLDFKCAPMTSNPKCFVGNIQELRQYRMEKHLESFDQQLICRAKDAILKRNHAFKKVWEVKELGESIDCQLGPEAGTINWKNWPPPVPHASGGVKIPVGLYPDVEYDVRNPCAVTRLDMGFAARPQEVISEETFAHLKGVLNTYPSTSFKVTPDSLIFPHSKLGHQYSAVLKLQNLSRVPRRIGVVAPKSRFFDIIWGAELNSETVIPPGLSVKIVVNFKPLSDVAVNDLLTILVHNDGILLVPLLTSSESPPVLEIDEFDCGCSILNRVKMSTFNIRNLSGSGRFWLLTEEEFAKEHRVELNPPKQEDRISMASTIGDREFGDEFLGEDSEEFQRKSRKSRYSENPSGQDAMQSLRSSIAEKAEVKLEVLKSSKHRKHSKHAKNQDGKGEDKGNRKRSNSKKTKKEKVKRDTLMIKPFKLTPCCFSLQRNESIEIKAKYKPTEANFHYEKLVLVCDNGEVRWIALKGIGVDHKKQEIVSVQGEWTGPPCDLPADLNTNLSIDCGDLLFGQSTQRKFVLVNNSCIPMYFFWSIRKLKTVSSAIYPGGGLQHFLEGCISADSVIDDEDISNPNDIQPPAASIQIYPSQGVLSCRQQMECLLTATAPQILGYHGCITSLFIQQVDEHSKRLLTTMIADLESRSLNTIPIYHQEVLSISSLENLPENPALPPGFHSGEGDFIPNLEPELPFESPITLPLTESRYLVPTPKFLTPDQAEGTKESSNVEFYLATLRLHLKQRMLIVEDELGGRVNDEDHSMNMEFENITFNKKKLQAAFSQKKRSSASEYNSIPIKEGRVLEPVKEFEVWLRTVPLQCYFDPPFIVASGTAASSLERRFVFHNQTQHPITISFSGVINEICSIVFTPSEFTASPDHFYEFIAKIHFEKSGEISDDLVGTLDLPFTSLECTLPFKIECTAPFVELLTPLINFGLVCYGQEKVKTLAIKNTGLQKCTWRANISKTGLRDEQDHLIAMDESNMEKQKFIRFWPEWGTLEPNEFTGIQVYLTPSVHGKITTSVEITVDGNLENCLCVPVWAEVQSPTLFLRNPNLILHDIFVRVPVRCASVILVNPTTFLVNFDWGEAIGAQKEFSRITVKPKYGTVLPRRWVQIQLTITVDRELVLNNLFLPCCVDGMKEPLVLQIEGEVRGPQISIILPETRPSRINTSMEEMGEAGEGGVNYIRRPSARRTGKTTTTTEQVGEEESGLGVAVVHALKTSKSKRGIRFVKETRKKKRKERKSGSGTSIALSKKSDRKRGSSNLSHTRKKSALPQDVVDAVMSMEREESSETEKKRDSSLKSAKSKSKMRHSSSRRNTSNAVEELLDKKKKKGKKHSKRLSTDSAAASSVVSRKKKDKKKRVSDPETVRIPKDKGKGKHKRHGKQSTSTDNEEEEEEGIPDSAEAEVEVEEGRTSSDYGVEFYAEIGCEDAGEYACSPLLAPAAPTPYHAMTPLNTPEEDNKIYFEEVDGKRVNKRTFVVNNASPMRAAFSFNVMRHPLRSWIDETKSPIENLIRRKMMSSSPQDIESMIFDKSNIAFEVSPKKGWIDPYATFEVSIILHTLSGMGTGRSVIYQDEVHCEIDGLAEPYVIKLEASVNTADTKLSNYPQPQVDE